MTGTLKCYVEFKKKEKVLFTRTPRWEEMGVRLYVFWEEYLNKPLRVKEHTPVGCVSADGT